MFKIKDNLDIVAYGAAVREIADKFFDSDSNYAPHIGKANAMVVFYNYFVIESKFSKMTPEEFTTDLFFTDEEFLSEYNKAIKDCDEIKFNFGNAYSDAIDIVNTRKSSIGRAVEMFERAIINLAAKLSPVFSDDKIDKIAKISDDIAKGDLSAESVVKAIGNKIR
jgi:hypothetical protein